MDDRPSARGRKRPALPIDLILIVLATTAASCVQHRGFPAGSTWGDALPVPPGDASSIEGGTGTGGTGGGDGSGGSIMPDTGTGGTDVGGPGTGGSGSGGSGTGGSGSGGSGSGGSGTGGTGSGGSGSGGQAMDAPPDNPPDTPPSNDGSADTTKADICAAYMAGSGSLPNVSTEDFCSKYKTVCTFGGASRYSDEADCFAKYTAATAAGKTCRAGHLCNAAAASPAIHCPHATGLAVCE